MVGLEELRRKAVTEALLSTPLIPYKVPAAKALRRLMAVRATITAVVVDVALQLVDATGAIRSTAAEVAVACPATSPAPTFPV